MAFDSLKLSNAQREYIETVTTLHQQQADFLPKMEKMGEKAPTNYRGRRIPLEIAANPSLAFGNIDGGDLATPGSPDYSKIQVGYTWMNTGLEQTYGALLNDGKETVSNLTRQTVESTSRTLVKWLNIFASNGDGTTKIAKTSASYDATNATTKKTFICNGSTDSIGATQVLVGQKVFIYDPTGTTQRVGTVGAGALTVASRTKLNAVTSTDLPSDYVSGDIMVPEGTVFAAGFMGVPAIIAATGDYFGLARSTVDTLQSTILSAGGAGLSTALLMRIYNSIVQRTGISGLKGEGALELGLNITQHTAYYNLMTATGNTIQWQHTGDSRPQVDVGGASEEFTWFGAKINRFLDFIGNAIFFINFSYYKIATLKEAGEMLDMPANDWLQAFNGTTSNYRAARQQWWDVARQYYSPAPHRMGALTSLDMTNLPMQKAA
jgi:hypothetical protein